MGRLQKGVLNIARRPAVTKFMSRALAPTDRVIRRVTRGRVTSTAQFLMPTLVLHSKGAKSGQMREHTLTYVRDEAGRPMLAGTNFGGDNHPAWTYNLLTNPEASVDIDGQNERVRAVRLSEEEMAQQWPRFDAVYPGYASYRERIGDSREIRVFRLDPAA